MTPTDPAALYPIHWPSLVYWFLIWLGLGFGLVEVLAIRGKIPLQPLSVSVWSLQSVHWALPWLVPLLVLLAMALLTVHLVKPFAAFL